MNIDYIKWQLRLLFLLKLTLQNVIRELTCEHEQRTTVLKFDKEELICLI